MLRSAISPLEQGSRQTQASSTRNSAGNDEVEIVDIPVREGDTSTETANEKSLQEVLKENWARSPKWGRALLCVGAFVALLLCCCSFDFICWLVGIEVCPKLPRKSPGRDSSIKCADGTGGTTIMYQVDEEGNISESFVSLPQPNAVRRCSGTGTSSYPAINSHTLHKSSVRCGRRSSDFSAATESIGGSEELELSQQIPKT